MEEQNVRLKVRQILTEYLTKNGHRKTPERYAILDAIYTIKGHFAIEQLRQIMSENEHFRVSRATLYNTISILLDAKLIIKHQFGNTSQYEKTFNKETHHHLICTECGKVMEVHNEHIQKMITETKFSHFQATHYSLYIYGICSKCAAAKRRKDNIKTNK